MPPKTPAVRKVGRPPAGAREGERVKDYPQLSIRLPAEMRLKLQALSRITARPQWRLVIDSIECYFRDLPAGEREMVEDLVKRSMRRKGKMR